MLLVGAKVVRETTTGNDPLLALKGGVAPLRGVPRRWVFM
jgi:hypothetical protein